MIAFIDANHGSFGGEPICKVLPITASTYHAHAAKRANPEKRSFRAKRDAVLQSEIDRVSKGTSVFMACARSGGNCGGNASILPAALVARLMRAMDLQGVIRGKPIRTTFSNKAAPCPLDHVNRQFHAPRPNALWGEPSPAIGSKEMANDFTYVSTWAGFVYVAFVIDTYARRIVGWWVSRMVHTGFVLDALEQLLHGRRPLHRGGLVQHSDRGSQYVSRKYSERLAEAGIEPSVGSVGDSYDNALSETINGLYKAEVIHRRGPWQNIEAVEFATLEWVDWFNHRRLLEPIGNIPPAEAEERYYAMLDRPAMAA